MPQPLTHHEILSLIEPFTRAGFQSDLAASDRLERRLVFKMRERCVELAPDLALRETLQLENPGAAFRLTRTLVCPVEGGTALAAHLVVEGPDPADLLSAIAAVDPDRHFRFGPNFILALSYRHQAGAGLVLTRMAAQAAGVSVSFVAPTIKADPDGAIVLMPGATGITSLPDDLLAVLGWNWGLVQRRGEGWKSRLRLRGREPQRSRATEPRLERMVAHLARTLADPPARFHERLVGARWRVVMRRARPLSIALLLILGAFAATGLHFAEDSSLRMLLFNAPPLLLVLVFCLRDVPVIEIPPLPRRSRALQWHTAPAASAAAKRVAV